MSKDTVIDLKKPEPFVEDPITAILRQKGKNGVTTRLAYLFRHIFFKSFFVYKFFPDNTNSYSNRCI